MNALHLTGKHCAGVTNSDPRPLPVNITIRCALSQFGQSVGLCNPSDRWMNENGGLADQCWWRRRLLGGHTFPSANLSTTNPTCTGLQHRGDLRISKTRCYHPGRSSRVGAALLYPWATSNCDKTRWRLDRRLATSVQTFELYQQKLSSVLEGSVIKGRVWRHFDMTSPS